MEHRADPIAVEKCSHEIVDCIRQFVDVLRAEFSVVARTLTTSTTAKHPCHLYTRMVEQGTLERVSKAVRNQRSLWNHATSEETQAVGQNREERVLLIQYIILPLLQSLANCYLVLDDTPDPEPQPSNPRSTRKNKPSPPVGMLSIQQYTDVACLLEFTVCSAIIPQLDSNILTSLEDRIRHQLPKSLAGRIPRSALKWESETSLKDDALLFETVSAISHVVMLDRFRPMLLPRHIADIYAAFFQLEHSFKYTRDFDTKLHKLSEKLGLTTSANNNTTTADDATLKAKAYQTLLLQGTKAPAWLRQRVGPLLTELACDNLACIVQVFVPIEQQNGEISSMASQRLGRTLSDAGGRVGPQIRMLLDVLFPTIEKGQIPAKAMAILQTVWAILVNWSDTVLQNELIRVWQVDLLDPDKVHVTLRQIGSLCASVPPPATKPWTVLQHLNQPPSIMGQLLRIASIHTVEKSDAKDEAKQILHWLSQASATSDNGPECLGPAQMASAWIEALAPSSWDLTHAYKVKPTCEKARQPTTLDRFEVESRIVGGFELADIVSEIEQRAAVFLETCTESKVQGLVSFVFRLLLKLYLSSQEGMDDQHVDWRHRLVTMAFLPILCETCSPEDLLFGHGSETSAIGLLHSIRMILFCCKARFCKGVSEALPRKEASEDKAIDEDSLMVEYLNHLKGEELSSSFTKTIHLKTDDEEGETLLSITSVVLSLLIAMLELGTKSRSDEEEDVLQSLLPTLTALAGFTNQVSSNGARDAKAGLSDMSGYALALIASRKAETKPLSSEAILSTMEKIRKMIRESEEDLASSQPPIRARGMVSLGRLARGYLGLLGPDQQKPKLVVEMDGGTLDDEATNSIVEEVIRLALTALLDNESYVYLAAVQTVVAIGDLQPKKVLPKLAAAVARGSLTFKEAEEISCTDEQRVKLAEALMFIIRRRATPDEYFERLVTLMVFGGRDKIGISSNSAADNQREQFFAETDKFFIPSLENDSFLEERTEQWKEKDTRLKTGGPIFALEENDLVRAARVSVLAELAAATNPSSLASRCHLLVRLATDILRLDESRSVSRAAALLVREIYGCLNRGSDEVSNEVVGAQRDSQLKLASTLVSMEEQERLLLSILHHHAGFLSTGDLVGGKRFHDPATSARCREALSLREDAEEIFVAATLLNTEERMLQLPKMLSSLVDDARP